MNARQRMALAPLTPSRAHDQAFKRDAGHDALQQEVLAFLRGRSLAQSGATIISRTVEAEMPFRKRGQIVAYADIGEIIDTPLCRIVNIYEIKPRIETVFGIVRQAKVLADLVQDIEADQRYVNVVVPHTDPLGPALLREWPRTWAWRRDFDWGAR